MRLSLTALLSLMFTLSFGQDWSEITKTLPEPYALSLSAGRFGSSIDMDGVYAVVGSSEYNGGTGEAYVFFYDGVNWIKQATLSASDANAGDYFGLSVAISGDVVVVGSPWDDDNGSKSGSLYVFERGGSSWGTMTETKKLTANDGDSSDELGFSVEIDGDVIVAGAYADEPTFAGAVYVFENTSADWTTAGQVAKLTASDAAIADQLGRSVGISGSTIIGGAPADDDGASSSGSVYLYEKPGGGWADATEDAKLTSSTPGSNDFLGWAIDIDGDNVVAGAHYRDFTGSSSGGAYVFTKPGASWVSTNEVAFLSATDGASDWELGIDVDIDGDMIVCGARGATGGAQSFAGKAYVYEKPGASWTSTTEIAILEATDPAANDLLGSTVAMSGDQIWVGAPDDASNGYASGTVYSYTNPGTWVDATETEQLLADVRMSDNVDENYGYSIAVDGDYAVIGVKAANQGEGMAYVLHFDGAIWVHEAVLTASDAILDDNFGNSVAIQGDIVLVGANLTDDGGSSSGSVYLFEKGAGWSDRTETAILTAGDAQGLDEFGTAVAIYNDVVVVGAKNEFSYRGAAYVFEKPGGGWVSASSNVKLTASDITSSDYLGVDVDIFGDNIVLGCEKGNGGKGAAYVYTKGGANWASMTETAKLTATDAASDDYFGHAVAIFADDIVVGAYLDDDGAGSSGSAYVFSKPSGGWVSATQDAKLNASDPASLDYLGWSVDIAHGVIAVGSYGDDTGPWSTGSVYLFYKNGDNWSTATQNKKILASDKEQDDNLGFSVALSRNHLVSGAIGEDAAGNSAGATYFYNNPCPTRYNSLVAASCGDYTSPSGLVWSTTGVYQDTIAGWTSCDSVITFDLTIDGPTVTADVNQISCADENDGSVSVATTIGGVGPYSYSFDNSTFGTTMSLTGLAAGTYTIYVQDAITCLDSSAVITITNPSNISVTANTQGIACNGDNNGEISLSAVGGTNDYTYSFDNISFSTANVTTGLAPGSYIGYAQDGNGCVDSTVIVTVTDVNPILAMSTVVDHLTCFGSDDGSISVMTTGGTSPYVYSIGSGSTGQSTFSGLATGIYAASITDDNGCVGIAAAVTVTSADAIVVTAQLDDNISCNDANDGEISLVSAAGGAGGFTYSIGAGFSGVTSYNNLAAGDYRWFAMDAMGCVDSSDVLSIVNPDILNITASANAISCNGESDGQVLVGNVTGGTLAYSFSIDNTNFSVDQTFTGLASGSYQIYVQDANYCSGVSSTVSITEPSSLSVTATSEAAKCVGEATGSITGTSAGGTLAYSYSIDGTNYQSSNLLTGLAAGTYTVYVEDGMGCVAEVDGIQIADAIAVSVTATLDSVISCADANNAVITAQAGGGSTPYAFSIDGVNYGGSSTFSNVGPGDYLIYVQDANGCEVETSTLSVVNPTTVSVTAVIEAGTAAGEFVITMNASGGSSPYQYAYDAAPYGVENEVTFNSSPGQIVGFGAMDANGCEALSNMIVPVGVSLVEFDVLKLEIYPNPSRGKIFVNATGEVTILNELGQEVARWSNNGSVSLSTGVYFVKVFKDDEVEVRKVLIH